MREIDTAQHHKTTKYVDGIIDSVDRLLLFASCKSSSVEARCSKEVSKSTFKKVSDVEVLGTQYEQLQGLFGVRLRVVKRQLGNESIELTLRIIADLYHC
jgi:hypothetical protein